MDEEPTEQDAADSQSDRPLSQNDGRSSGPPMPAAKSAARTVELLEFLAQAERKMTLAQLQRELPYPRSSLHVLLRTLTTAGWLETDTAGTAYGIGVRALLVGAAYLEGDPAVNLAGPILVSIRHEVDETAHIARLDNDQVVYLASRESSHHLRTSSRIGRRLPAHSCALGKSLLAARDDSEVTSILPPTLEPATPKTITRLPDLFADLHATRLRGWAIEQEENTPGLGCVAVAIPHSRPPTDALSCSVPLARLTDEHRKKIVDCLLRHAQELADSLRFLDRRMGL